MSQDRSAFVPIASLLLIVSALTGQYLAEDTLATLRTPAAQRAALRLPSGQNIDARLWQDPVGVALDWRRESKDSYAPAADSHTIEGLVREIQRVLDGSVDPKAQNQKRLCVIPVMIPGGPYAEDVEHRRRLRVAVVSALMSAYYVPRYTEHIGWFQVRHTSNLKAFGGATGLAGEDEGLTELASASSVPVPYEWFEWDRRHGQRRPGQAPTVLVLWVPDTALGRDPLAGVERVVGSPLARYLADTIEGWREVPRALKHLMQKCVIRVVGPSSSDMLAKMVKSRLARKRRRTSRTTGKGDIWKAVDWKLWTYLHGEAKGLASRDGRQGVLWPEFWMDLGWRLVATVNRFLIRGRKHRREVLVSLLLDRLRDGLCSNVTILSPRATVPDAHLLIDAKDVESVDEVFCDGKPGVFVRTVPTDAALMKRMVCELAEQGIRPGTDGHRIALIAERDSLYGRTVERTFEAAVALLAEPSLGSVDDIVVAARNGGKNLPAAWPEIQKAVVGFSYLRGIDGVTPSSKPQKEDAGRDKKQEGGAEVVDQLGGP